MKKNVPALRLVTAADTATNVPRLPEERSLVLGDIAGAAREGLLALSVATGMAVMQAIFEEEITGVVGPRGRHDGDRTAVRHGTEQGSVELGGRRVAVPRPRARTGRRRGVGRGEVHLEVGTSRTQRSDSSRKFTMTRPTEHDRTMSGSQPRRRPRHHTATQRRQP